ncbi:MAG: methyltransferase domain-containing protein, partial [Terriglobia bacterium]
MENARSTSWRSAARSRFTDPEMINGLLNLQRASWLPLLGLPADAVALDVGCGYGAIAHSLALAMKEVCAIEAVPERIEFTQERLRQEKLDNVTLVQASAMDLPFFESSFDLVVLNGILEWVGEWDPEGRPRDVQLKFLSSVRRLLKDGGVAVIGIENRFSLGSILGGQDHSGIQYTSLVPRWFATRMLRRSSTAHYRTVLNAKKEYRTYTYSAPGYRKLVAEAGYGASTVYWAIPNYNEPSQLVPVEARPLIREVSLDFLDHPGRPGRSALRRKAKRMLAGSSAFRWLLPNFVIVASKNPDRRNEMELHLRELLGGNSSAASPEANRRVFASSTRPFTNKSVLRPCGPAAGDYIIKANLHAPSTASESVRAELENLSQVRKLIQADAKVSFRVPEPVGSISSGKIAYAVESEARGVKFSRLVRTPGYAGNLEGVEKQFGQVLAAIADMSRVLRKFENAPAIDSGWYNPPDEIRQDGYLAGTLQERRYIRKDVEPLPALWVQHGDLSVENVFLDKATGKVEVIDWSEVAAGLPPLYDAFMLILSSALLDPSSKAPVGSSPQAGWLASFSDMFLSTQGLGVVFR